METSEQVTIQRTATVVEAPLSEQRTRAEILAEVQRLGLDSRHAIDASGVSDDSILALVNEDMLRGAVADTQSALGLQDWYKFDPLTGVPLPELKRQQVRFSDGTILEGGIDMSSYRQRLAAIKGLLSQRVQEAQAKGAKLPAVDPLTGQAVTLDSLAAYDAVFNPDKWQARQTSKPVTIQSTHGLTVLQGGSVPPDSGQVTIARTQSIPTTPTPKAA